MSFVAVLSKQKRLTEQKIHFKCFTFKKNKIKKDLKKKDQLSGFAAKSVQKTQTVVTLEEKWKLCSGAEAGWTN